MTNTTCADWTHWEGKKLDCAKYVADGKCTTNTISSHRPCCKCKANYRDKVHPRGGEHVREYGELTDSGVQMMVDPACFDKKNTTCDTCGPTFCERMCGFCDNVGLEKFAANACPYTCKRCKRLPIFMDKCEDTNTTAGLAKEDNVT